MEIQDRNTITVECARLTSFLENNQLVQANAVCQRLEGMLHDLLTRLQTKAEDDPLWKGYKACIRIRSNIMAGKARDALAEAKGIRP